MGACWHHKLAFLPEEYVFNGRCQVIGLRSLFGDTDSGYGSVSRDTSRLSPFGESSASKDPMVDGSEVVTANSEEVLNRTVDGKKELGLGH